MAAIIGLSYTAE